MVGTGTETEHRSVEQNSPEVNPHTSDQLTYDEARIYSGEKTAFSISDAGKTGHLHVKE